MKRAQVVTLFQKGSGHLCLSSSAGPAASREFRLICLSRISCSTSYCHTDSGAAGKGVFGAIYAVGCRDSDEGIGTDTALVRAFSGDEARPAPQPRVPAPLRGLDTGGRCCGSREPVFRERPCRRVLDLFSYPPVPVGMCLLIRERSRGVKGVRSARGVPSCLPAWLRAAFSDLSPGEHFCKNPC